MSADIDIDLADRDQLLKLIRATPARQSHQGQVRRHNSGIYVTDIPYDPVNACAAIDYEQAEQLGYFKIDLLNMSVYQLIESPIHYEEMIAKDPQAFILKQGWAAVSLDSARGLMELRSLYEHLQARILELIDTLDELRASPDYEIYQAVEKDAEVIGRIAEAQRAELEREIEALKAEAQKQAAEAGELVGEEPF